MIGHLPPFAIAPSRFRFRALASHAGRASLGGDREIALACFVASRLGAGLLPPFSFVAADAGRRAAGARQWLASLSMPPALKSAAGAAIDASADGQDVVAAQALADLLLIASVHLDEGSFTEIRELIDELAHDSTEFTCPPSLRR
ncbi:MAG: hypothetical protein H0T48_17120 [Gemmatimonadaceae bacterium]|nr:hypothetical protein [Gemmatimonadaceae bacterium]